MRVVAVVWIVIYHYNLRIVVNDAKAPLPAAPRPAYPGSPASITPFSTSSSATRCSARRWRCSSPFPGHRRDKITPPRYTALVILAHNPGISQTTLGEVLGIARSGAMMLTDWMEDRGLAERRHRPDDGRAWGLFLTVRGERLVTKRSAACSRKSAAARRPRRRRTAPAARATDEARRMSAPVFRAVEPRRGRRRRTRCARATCW